MNETLEIFAGFFLASPFLFFGIRRLLLHRPRKQVLALVEERGGAIDLLEADEAVRKIRWGTEALDGLIRDGTLCEGWRRMPEPPRPPPPPGHRNIPSSLSWVVCLPSFPSR